MIIHNKEGWGVHMDQTNGNMYRMITVCVDDYSNGILNGRVNIPFLQAEYSFRNTMDFLKKTDVMLEKMKFPTSISKCGSFSAKRPEAAAPAQTVEDGKLATFLLRVIFRENASWQGSLVWMEGRQGESFRSTLEMLMLMDSALVKAPAA